MISNMKVTWTACLLIGCFGWILLSFFPGDGGLAADDAVTLFREPFDNLDTWEPFHFAGISRHTTYAIQTREDLSVLAATSDNSASALVCKQQFNISEVSTIRWRWKIDNVYTKGNYRNKSGDDYPIRIYIAFAYDPGKAPLGLKFKYGLAKAIYGRYPPLCSINYIWANRDDETERVFSPYTRQSIMIPLQQGRQKAGQWVEEVVDVRRDYIQSFGGDPPTEAYLAVMNDSDNTGEQSSAYIDFIEVRR